VLRGERRQDAGVPKEAFLRVERPVGRFSVQVALPPSVDEQGIRAAQRDGVLEVSLPKRGEKPSSRLKIEVK
jgi:HSP20 family protein